jgi:type II secretory pathway component PulJ
MSVYVRNVRGFTLIETLIAATISLVVVVGLVTFLYMYNRATKEGTANAMLQQQTEIAFEQLSRDIWMAVQVTGPTESWSATPDTTEMSATEIRLHNPDHLIFAAYKIENGQLMETHPSPAVAALTGGEFQPFTVGSSMVMVNPGSTFKLSARRTSATVNLSLKTLVNNLAYTSPVRWEKIGCRNGG